MCFGVFKAFNNENRVEKSFPLWVSGDFCGFDKFIERVEEI